MDFPKLALKTVPNQLYYGDNTSVTSIRGIGPEGGKRL